MTLRSEAGICDALLKGTKTLATWTGKTVKIAGKFTFYPVVLPAQFVRDGLRETQTPSRLLTFPFRFLWKEKYYLSAFLTVALATEGTYVSGLEFVQRTESLVPTALDAPIVVVDGFGTGLDPMRFGPAYLELMGYPNHTNVHFINPRTAEELLAGLKEIREKHGRIALMDFTGHGTEGVSYLAGKPLNPSEMTPLEDVFEKDASIRLMNCRVGSGCTAPGYLKKLGSVFLDRGGRVVATQKYLASGLTDLALVGARAVLGPDSVYPDWVVSFSKFVQSPWMIPYAALSRVTANDGWIPFLENEFSKLDFLHIDVVGRR